MQQAIDVVPCVACIVPPSSRHDATWSQNLASLFHSGFILFPRFKLMFHSMYAPEIEHGTRKWTPGDPFASQVLPVLPFGFPIIFNGVLLALHRSAAKGSRYPIRHPSGLYSSGTACISQWFAGVEIGDAANFGQWNADNSDNWQPPTTNSCRKCSEAARNNVKLWDIQPIHWVHPSMVNIYSWLCVFARIFAIEYISMKVFKSTTMQRDGHVACHGVLPHVCSTWTIQPHCLQLGDSKRCVGFLVTIG